MLSYILAFAIGLFLFYCCTLLLKVIPQKGNAIRWLCFIPLFLLFEFSFTMVTRALFLGLFSISLSSFFGIFQVPLFFGIVVYKVVPSHQKGIINTFALIIVVLDVLEILLIEDSSHPILFWILQAACCIITATTVKNMIKE